MEELKTCPFCGGKAQQSYAGAKHIIICPNCVKLPADGGYIDSKDAVTAWNTRTNNWISIDEKLPTVDPRYGDIDVLVHMDDGFIATTAYVEDGGFELWADSGEVTHWMPLPEPPKGSE